MSAFIPGSTTGLLVQGNGLSNLYSQDWNNFGPRFGFSFQPRENGGLVVRGLFGVYYDASSLSPFFDNRPNYGVINQVESNGNGNYDSLQATVRTSGYHGLSTVLIYTWSHSLDDMTVYRSRLPQDSTNLKGDYGNSDYDTRNNFNGAVFTTFPSGTRTGRAFLGLAGERSSIRGWVGLAKRI